ncbi:helix-turn-helix domain-containing protein, partial [Caproicibacter fermentans]|uniref:helix-turn-helix domain-containing protein n=1 Tax=Caproicibacter fermentans TaxID=2576756 RepID=UPI0012EDE4C0
SWRSDSTAGGHSGGTVTGAHVTGDMGHFRPAFWVKKVPALTRGYVCKILSEKEFEEKTRSLKHFNTVLQFIEDNYDKKIRLKELADSANLSACHFCRTFKQITGKTLTNYVNEIRLEKAACFLKQTDLNITETALKCGFDSISYFNRLFSRHYKISPTKFRKANMQ